MTTTAAYLAIDTSATVPVLGMVQIVKTTHHLLFRATNRYHLIEVRADLLDDAPTDEWEALLDGPDVKQILTALPKKVLRGTPGVALGPDDEMAFNVAIEDGTNLRLRLQDQDFPKVAGLFPDTVEAVEGIRLNTKLLAALCKMPGQGSGYVKFHFHGAKPARVEWEDENNRVSYRYLLMPVRDDS